MAEETSSEPSVAPEAPGSPSAEEAAKALLGKVISDRYRLVEVVAIGGMGAVFRADHLLLRKKIAIKLLRPETKGLAEHVARFEREAIAGAHIRHPNVAAATDFGRLDDGSYFLVLEYVRGVTLDQVIKQGPMDPSRAAGIARQLAEALGAAHEMGVIHRDVKPRNVMLEQGRSDLVKLIDFGFAEVPLERLSMVGGEEDPPRPKPLTLSGMVLGTIAYMAPEAALGMQAVDERSDLYALGLILYEMLCGRHPFDGVDPRELFQQQRTQPPPPLGVRAPGVSVPRALEDVVMRLLRKEPARRYHDAKAVIAALDAAAPRVDASSLIPWRSPLPMPMSVAGADVEENGSSDSGPEPPAGADVEENGSSDSGPEPPAVAAPDTPSPSEPSAPLRDYTPRLSARATRRGVPPWAIGGLLAAVAIPILVLALRSQRAAPEPLGQAPAATPAPAAAPTTLPAVAVTPRPAPATGSAATAGAAAAAQTIDAVASAAPAGSAASGASSAGTAAAASATAGPGEAAGAADASPRQRLVDAAKTKSWDEGESALFAVIESDAAALEDDAVSAAAAAVAVKSAFRGDARTDQLFGALADKLGTPGLDVLYQVLSGYGGTKGAQRAADELHRPAALARATPALKVALALRDAPCRTKGTLFGRAGTVGDARALALLELWRSPQCNARVGQCCFHNNAMIEGAIAKLRYRLHAK